MILVIHIWISVWIIYISPSKQPRNIVQLCTKREGKPTLKMTKSAESNSFLSEVSLQFLTAHSSLSNT